eukprot:gene17804-biopygen9899
MARPRGRSRVNIAKTPEALGFSRLLPLNQRRSSPPVRERCTAKGRRCVRGEPLISPNQLNHCWTNATDEVEAIFISRGHLGPSTPGVTGHARATPAPCPRHPSQKLPVARATPAPVSCDPRKHTRS